MVSTSDSHRLEVSGTSPRADLLDEFRQRLHEAMSLTDTVRASLLAGDEASILEATARLRTVAAEYKVLSEEYSRLDRAAEQGPHEDPDNLERARAELEQVATEAVRAGAIAGGLLERMVRMSRALIEAVSVEAGTGYLPTGRPAHGDLGATSLRERA
ncbi:hypothetical protein ABI59_14685 [Acidobacteria bacterium Mor1]|nr:hypothetical protein ABI59_14685 [Acidobacteria bacterium Mor1]